jgi:hypothetical protein
MIPSINGVESYRGPDLGTERNQETNSSYLGREKKKLFYFYFKGILPL